MLTKTMDAVIHFRHSREEIAELEGAIGPMLDQIKRVSTYQDRGALKAMLAGEFFRLKDAVRVRAMLLRSCKHARATLHEYFPMMQSTVVAQAEALEDATARYWRTFERLRQEELPIH
jgi:hypothetical protein